MKYIFSTLALIFLMITSFGEFFFYYTIGDDLNNGLTVPPDDFRFLLIGSILRAGVIFLFLYQWGKQQSKLLYVSLILSVIQSLLFFPGIEHGLFRTPIIINLILVAINVMLIAKEIRFLKEKTS